MATRTFVADGTSRNWSANTSWVEGVAPTAADNVVFSTNVASSTLVIDGTSGAPNLCRSMDTTGYTRTITFALGKQLNVGDGTAGAFKMTAGMTFAPSSSSTLKFVSTTTGNNITFASYVFGAITFDGVGGGWQFQDTNSMATDTILTLTNGALDTNSKTQTNNLVFSSNNANTRSLTLGTTNFKLTISASATPWDITTSTGMTLSAASSTITFNTTTTSQTFAGGGLTYGTVTCTTPTTAAITITGANTFGTLTTSVAGSTKNTTSGYSLAANQTVTGTWTSNGSSVSLRNFIYSNTTGTARTISAGTATVTQTDFRDITGAGGASPFALSAITGGAGDGGGNSGITFASPKNCFAKLGGSSSTWGVVGIWKTLTGGVVNISPGIPLIHDNAIMDANSFTAGSLVLTIDQPRVCDQNWTGTLNTPAYSENSLTYEIYGGIVMVSGMTWTNQGIITWRGRSAYTLDAGGHARQNNMTLNAPSGTLSLGSNLTSFGNVVTVANGTWSQNGFTLSAGEMAVSGGAWSGTGAITLTSNSGATVNVTGGTVTLGGNMTGTATFAVSGGTFDMNGYNATGFTTVTISGTGILSLSGQLSGSGTVANTGGTINDTGASGEFKGAAAVNFSGGTSVCRKITVGTTLTLSSTASLTLSGSSATYATNWNITGATCTFKAGTVQLVNGTWSVGIDSYTYAG